MTVPHHSEPARDRQTVRDAIAAASRSGAMGWADHEIDEATDDLISALSLSASPAPAAGGLEAVALVTTKTQLHHGYPVGTTVYEFAGYDYGCASEDTAKMATEYRAYTLNKDGSAPFFTHPVNGLASPAATSAETQGGDGVLSTLNRMVTDYLTPATYKARFPICNVPWHSDFPMPDTHHSEAGAHQVNRRRDQAFINDVIHLQDNPLGVKPREPAALAPSTSAATRGETCDLCNGHGLIGGWRVGDGYDAEPCPDCTPPAPAVESAQVKVKRDDPFRPAVDVDADDDYYPSREDD